MMIMENPEQFDRVIVLINDLTIGGNTRIQKYAFLVHQLYDKELEPNLKFYNDWIAYRYGPFSKELELDLKTCVENKLVARTETPVSSGREFTNYSLTMKGRMRMRKLSENNSKMVKKLYEKFTLLNKKSTATILKDIYLAYPQFTINSEIRDQVLNDQI